MSIEHVEFDLHQVILATGESVLVRTKEGEDFSPSYYTFHPLTGLPKLAVALPTPNAPEALQSTLLIFLRIPPDHPAGKIEWHLFQRLKFSTRPKEYLRTVVLECTLRFAEISARADRFIRVTTRDIDVL